VTAVAPEAQAQPAASKPTSLYAHDLRVRKGGTVDYTPDTPKFGLEVFKDDATTAVIFLTQTGNLAVIPATAVGNERKAVWLFAHDMRARKADDELFKNATKFGVEVFKDQGTGKLVYISETASIAVAGVPAMVGTDKGPEWHHGLLLKVRGPEETGFGAATKKFGVEVFKDGNTGGLMYISELGAIATAPAPAQPPAPDKVKAPKALYGLTLRVRKADETEFGPMTKKLGIEVFKDENTGGLIYISENGSLATSPAPAEIKTGLGVLWKHAMKLRARAGGVTDFMKGTGYGIEVFTDNNTGHTIFASETGAIAVLPKK